LPFTSSQKTPNILQSIFSFVNSDLINPFQFVRILFFCSLLSLILPRAALVFKANNRTFDAAGKNNRSENAPKGIDAAGKNGRIRMKTVKNSKRISE
jgi:hypothetical protein